MANIVMAKYFNTSKVIQESQKRSLMRSGELLPSEIARIRRAKKISPAAERRAWMAVKERLLKEENKKMPILVYIR